MHYQTWHAYGMIKAVREPPARLPALAAARVMSQVEVYVYRRKVGIIHA